MRVHVGSDAHHGIAMLPANVAEGFRMHTRREDLERLDDARARSIEERVAIRDVDTAVAWGTPRLPRQ